MKPGLWLPAALLASMSLSACVPLTADGPERRELFTAFHQADLSRFDHALSLEEHSHRPDAWTELGRAFLQLANCQEISPPSALLANDDEALAIYRRLRLEDQRRLRLVATSRLGGDRQWHRGTIHTRLASRTYFSRDPAAVEDDLIRWPPSDERWPDEWPAPSEVPYECEDLLDRLSDDLLDEFFTEWALTGDILRADPDDLLVKVHRADLVLAILDGDFDLDDDRRDEALEMAAEALEDLRHTEAPEEHERLAITRWGQALRKARLAIELDDPQAATYALSELTDHPVIDVAETARYLRTRIAWRQGWFEVAADDATPLRRSSPLFNAHLYFTASANRYLGHSDRFLGLAREALSDRQRPRDPFLGALYKEVLQELVRFDVDERTLEFLEELGPRAGLSERRRELAEVALDAGRPEVARELATPLLEETRDARRLPRIHAVLALAAFLEDDRRAFDDHLHELTRRSDALESAIPRQRRAQFYAHRDAELARVLRAMLPMMAEWGDDGPARALRQVWLVRIVEHAQRFLRDAPESAVSDQLTDLYTLASQLLEDHPRGYARRVGDESYASALVLGTVSVSLAPPDDEAPAPRLRWAPIDSLLLIPVDPIPPTTLVHDFQREVEP